MLAVLKTLEIPLQNLDADETLRAVTAELLKHVPTLVSCRGKHLTEFKKVTLSCNPTCHPKPKFGIFRDDSGTLETVNSINEIGLEMRVDDSRCFELKMPCSFYESSALPLSYAGHQWAGIFREHFPCCQTVYGTSAQVRPCTMIQQNAKTHGT
jgi:hypothetical protein